MVNFNPSYLFPPLPSIRDALFRVGVVQQPPPQPSFTAQQGLQPLSYFPLPVHLPGIRTLFGSFLESTPFSLPLVVDFQRRETTLPSSPQRSLGPRVTQVHPRVSTPPGPEERWFPTGDLVRRFGCRTCEKIFAQIEDFRRHDRIHTGERPFECDICHNRFIQKGHLTEHRIRRHFPSRTFHCPTCPSSFIGKRELRRHMKKHES